MNLNISTFFLLILLHPVRKNTNKNHTSGLLKYINYRISFIAIIHVGRPDLNRANKTKIVDD